jgi:hypothetical protein
MLGEGFDHPPLSVAAIFCPYRSLSPYIQFVGRVMRVIHEDSPGHDDNHAYIVSHVGLNNDAHWEDFKELDFDDQQMFRDWVNGLDEEASDGKGRPRRFDAGMLVDDEIVGEFIKKSFLDPDDDRVLKEMLDRDIGGGLRVRDVVEQEVLRITLRQKQQDNVGESAPILVQPQAKRVQARKRLAERAGAVAGRVLQDLALSPVGREVGRIVKTVSGRDNRAATIELMHRHVNEFLEIERNQRADISGEQAERALESLDAIGDRVRELIRAGTEG